MWVGVSLNWRCSALSCICELWAFCILDAHTKAKLLAFITLARVFSVHAHARSRSRSRARARARARTQARSCSRTRSHASMRGSHPQDSRLCHTLHARLRHSSCFGCGCLMWLIDMNGFIYIYSHIYAYVSVCFFDHSQDNNDNKWGRERDRDSTVLVECFH